MSRVLEKSFGGLFSSIFNSNSTSGGVFGEHSQSGRLNGVSLGLINFVERLEAARKISRQEEENVVQEDCKEWVRLASKQNAKDDVISDNLRRSLIGFSRGHFTDLLIHAIKLTQSDQLFYKKVGYLYLHRTMSPTSDMTVLLVNTIQRDLCSANVMQVSFGLNLMPLLTSLDVSTLLFKSIVGCLGHKQIYIRKKAAVMAQMFFSKSIIDRSEGVSHTLIPHLLQSLADSDPGVAMASINTLSNAFKIFRECFESETRDDIARGAAYILLQATQGSLAHHYNVGPVNAPFVQVQMLRAIRNLSGGDWDAPVEITESVENVFSQPWGGKNLILYVTLMEAVLTAAYLPMDANLRTQSMKIILGFLKSSQIDFKYIGIKLLADVFHIFEENLRADHLEAVLECLNLSNSLLQSKTIKLLSAMANKHNYQAICTTLMEFSNKPGNKPVKNTIHNRLAEMLNRPYVDFRWCVSFLTPILESTDVDEEFLIALRDNFERGLKDTEMTDKSAIINTCHNNLFYLLLNNENLSIYKLTTFAFISNTLLNFKPESINDNQNFYEIFIEKCNNLVLGTKHCDYSYIFDCLYLCGLHSLYFRDKVTILLNKYSKSSRDTESCLKAKEKLLLLSDIEATSTVFKKKNKILNGATKPDLSLSFYDALIVEALEKGFPPYRPFSLKSNPLAKNYLKVAGSINPFDMKETSLSQSADKDTASTSSLPSSSHGLSSSISGCSVRTQRIWTANGREKLSTSYQEIEDFPQMSDNVEVATEAEEENASHAADGNQQIEERPKIISDKQTELAKTLVKSFGLSK